MKNDTIKGTAKKAAGSVESAYGKATGDKSTQYKGEAKKAEGEVQKNMGKAEEKIDKAANDADDELND